MKFKLKSITAIFLAVIIVFSLGACSGNEPETPPPDSTEISTEAVVENTSAEEGKNEEKTTEETTEEAEIQKETTTKQHYYVEPDSQKSESDLKKAINAIMQVEFEGTYEPFISYDIYSKPETELEYIYTTDYADSCNPDLYPIDYNWYNNGIVDEDLLYQKIILNTRKGGIRLTEDCRRIAEMVAYVAQYNIDYMMENHPSFNFNIPLYHLDTVSVDTSDEEWYYSLYVYDTNRILVNFTDIDSEEFFRSTVSHEVFHLMNRGEVGLDKVYLAGSSVDSLETEDRPFEQNFINEWYVDTASYKAFGEEPSPYSYAEEKRVIDLLCAATDKDLKYFEEVAFGIKKDNIYYAFEEELRNPNYVYSTLYAFDFSCFYYGNIISINDFDYFEFIFDAEEYAVLNVMKNAYIRLLKEIYAGKTDYWDANAELKEMYDISDDLGHNHVYESAQREELDKIFFEYAM